MGEELTQVQSALSRTSGAGRSQLESREAALASELRSLRRMETASTQLAARLAELTAQLESLVTDAAQLVASTGEAAAADLSSLSSELTSLSNALDETKRLMTTAPPSAGDS